MLEKLLQRPSEDIKLIESKKAPTFSNRVLLFSTQKFIELNKDRHLISYTAQLSGDEPVCNISFDFMDDKAISLLYCPYASLSIFKKVDSKILTSFIESVIEKLYIQSVKEIIIKLPPHFIEDNQENGLDKIFENCGFKIQSSEINHHITLDQNDYWDSIHQMQRRKIKKCIESGFQVQQEPIDSIAEIHYFIEKCRTQTGIGINISRKNLINAFEQLPDQYESFTVRNSANQIMAATVSVKVTEDVVYNYLPAFDRTFKTYSPLTLLTHHLVDRFKNEGYKYLDLGISSINGTPQKSLITFKERMGAIESNRLTYHLEF